MTSAYLDKVFDVECIVDVPFGVGGIGYVEGRGPARYRDLKLDVYRPVTDDAGRRPALILAFGGAFHRGSKGAEVFEGENPNTAMAEYCHAFAQRGYVCFSIDYRLMQEAPDPGVTPILFPDQPQNRDRIDFVRDVLGLPPSTPQMMAGTIEAATDDVTKAVSFVRSRSRAYNVDVTRIAVGGFSAGASVALNSAFAEYAPVAAVVALSGRIAAMTMDAYLESGIGGPPTLVLYGQNDLALILGGIDEMRARFTKAGVANTFVDLPGQTHFYLRSATLGSIEGAPVDGSPADVEAMIAAFLHRHLRLDNIAAAA